jgi:hypothetical protein
MSVFIQWVGNRRLNEGIGWLEMENAMNTSQLTTSIAFTILELYITN